MGNRAVTGGFRIPKFVVYTLTLLGLIDKTISSFCSFILGLFHYIKIEPSSNNQEHRTPAPFEPPLSAVLLRELLPAVKFSEVALRNGGGGGDEQPPQECAVCLYEFEGDQEIRCLKNCQHLFHMDCVDRWMDEDQETCPLCRESLVPVDSRKDYYNELRTAFCGDYCLIDED